MFRYQTASPASRELLQVFAKHGNVQDARPRNAASAIERSRNQSRQKSERRAPHLMTVGGRRCSIPNVRRSVKVRIRATFEHTCHSFKYSTSERSSLTGRRRWICLPQRQIKLKAPSASIVRANIRLCLDWTSVPNFISKSILPWFGRYLIQQFNVLPLRTAVKKPVQIKVVVRLHLSIRYLEVEVWFGAVYDIAVNKLLGTFVIDCYVHSMFLVRRKKPSEAETSFYKRNWVRGLKIDDRNCYWRCLYIIRLTEPGQDTRSTTDGDTIKIKSSVLDVSITTVLSFIESKPFFLQKWTYRFRQKRRKHPYVCTLLSCIYKCCVKTVRTPIQMVIACDAESTAS